MTLVLAWEALQQGHDLLTLEELLARPAWMADALCREYPCVTFFPGQGESLEPARDVCARCAVRDECLDFALTLDRQDGVYAGTSAKERRRLRRPIAA